MCNILISKETSNKELDFIIYNVVFSETRGSFTTNDVYKKLKEYDIDVEMNKLEEIFEKWTEIGLIFKSSIKYIIK